MLGIHMCRPVVKEAGIRRKIIIAETRAGVNRFRSKCIRFQYNIIYANVLFSARKPYIHGSCIIIVGVYIAHKCMRACTLCTSFVYEF